MMSQSRARLTILAATLALAGCSARSSAPTDNGAGDASGVGTGHSSKGISAPARTGCNLSALGLAAAKAVTVWQPPAGCTAKGSLGQQVIAIRSEAELADHFACSAGVTSGIDFGRDQLMLQHRSLSPAATGGEIVDDGTTVTYVTHFRHTCPDEPRPMPMGYTVTYLLPAGATRTFAESSCTLGGQPKCK